MNTYEKLLICFGGTCLVRLCFSSALMDEMQEFVRGWGCDPLDTRTECEPLPVCLDFFIHTGKKFEAVKCVDVTHLHLCDDLTLLQ